MENRNIPSEQALISVINKARLSFKWLKGLDVEWEQRRKNGKDGSEIRKQQNIILDAFTIYIYSLVDNTRGVHSLLRSYKSNDFILEFQDNSYVKLCVQHRLNRAGHQSKKYGSVANLKLVLNSHLDVTLKDIYYLVGTRKMNKK